HRLFRGRSEDRKAERETIHQHILLGMIGIWTLFILLGKVGSTQYGLWLMPLVPLVRANRKLFLAYSLFCLSCCLAYPWFFADILGVTIGEPPAVLRGPTPFGSALLIARTVSLVWMVILIIRLLNSINVSDPLQPTDRH